MKKQILSKHLLRILAVPIIFLISSPSFSQTDELRDIKVRGFDEAKILSKSDLKGFSQFEIMPIEISFNDHWLRQFRSELTDRDLEQIKARYSRLLATSFEKSFSKKGQFSNNNSENARKLIIKAKLENLRITAPNNFSSALKRVLVNEFGRARLNVSFIDAKNQQVVAQFIDQDDVGKTNFHRLEKANRVSNTREFRLVMNRWTKRLAKQFTQKSKA